LQQVGGGAGFSLAVQVAPALDPATILPPTATPSGPVAPSAKRGPRARQRAYGRKLGLALFTTLSGALAFSILSDGGHRTRRTAPLLPAADQVLSWTGLRIDQVAVSGQRLTSDTDIFDAIDMPSARSLLTFDSTGARERIERLPWIATASVNRVFPGTLDIRVTEREPAALWQRGGHEYLIDATGRVLSAVRPGMQLSLPRVAGEGAATHAQALLDLVVRYPRIKERFKVAERVGERRWTLRLKDGVTVHLGADREAAAFAALSSDDDLGRLLSGRDLTIDLRTRGRITVRPDPQPGPAASAPQSQPRS
jgi:cell division protein FtsQ